MKVVFRKVRVGLVKLSLRLGWAKLCEVKLQYVGLHSVGLSNV